MKTYQVSAMRVIHPSAKVALKNPERWVTVKGVFHAEDGTKLSITSINIDKADALAPEFDINLVAGTLTLPAGERGRKPAAALAEATILDELNALRNS
jgi:hypothetical protein